MTIDGIIAAIVLAAGAAALLLLLYGYIETTRQ